MNTFQEKLSELYRRFAYQGKGGTNAHYKYRFVQESQLKRVLNQALRDLGLVLKQVHVDYVGDPKSGTANVQVLIEDPVNKACVNLCGIGGGVDSSDKAPAKAMVAAFKYAFLCGLSVETGEQLDTEADAESDEAAATELLGLLASASTMSAVIALKPRVGCFQGGPRFTELRQAYYDAVRANDGT